MMKRWATLIALAVTATALALPGMAVASTTEAIADTGGMTLTLGVVGSPLDVAVTLDEIGHITDVTVGDGFTEDRATEHKVRFSEDDGSTRIDVKAKNHKLSASVKSDELAAILGSHTWAGKLFGSDTDTVVAFDVLENAAGYPELANVAVAAVFPGDVAYEIGDIKNETEDDEAESTVKVSFTWNGYTMTLKIVAEAEFDDDDDDGTEVKLKVELRGRDIQKLSDQSLADLVGTHTWDGRLCDGTPLAVTYTISGSGDVAVDGVTVDGAASDAYELKLKNHGFKLEFENSKARLSVELKQSDGALWDLKVKSKTTEKCDHDNDSDDDDDHRDKSDKKAKKDRDHDDDDDHGDDHGDDDHDRKDDD